VLAFGSGLVTSLSGSWLKAFGMDFPGAGSIITILSFIGLRLVAAYVFGRRLLDRFKLFMLGIPVSGSIYSGAKPVLQTTQGMGSGLKPKRAVVWEYLVSGSYLFRYATGHFTEAGSGRKMTTVFVPTAPNATTGLLLAIPVGRVRDCDWSRDRATKMPVSGGLFTRSGPSLFNRKP